MKLSDRQIDQIEEVIGNEDAHMLYDMMIESRLEELDKEFYDEMQKKFEEFNFWYA